MTDEEKRRETDEILRRLEQGDPGREERMRQLNEAGRRADETLDKLRKDSQALHERARAGARERALKQLDETFAGVPRKIRVNKRTHRVRFEGETESEVTIVIEKKGDNP